MSEPPALRVPTALCSSLTNTPGWEYGILCVYDVSWDHGGAQRLGKGKKEGKVIKSLAEKGISCAQKRIRPLAPY